MSLVRRANSPAGLLGEEDATLAIYDPKFSSGDLILFLRSGGVSRRIS